MEHFALFAYFHFECKTSPRYEIAKKMFDGIIKDFQVRNVAIFQPAWRDTQRSVVRHPRQRDLTHFKLVTTHVFGFFF